MIRYARVFWRRHQLALCVLPLSMWVGCDLPGKPDPANKPIMPDQVVSFDRLFAANCAGCHGAKGKLGPAPPLNDPLFVAIVPEGDLVRVIREGRRGTPMPPFARKSGGPLTDEQATILVEGIRSRWKQEEQPAEAPPSYSLANGEDVHASSGSRERGSAIFAQACAGCHGADGAGIDRDGVMTNAINVPAFLALISDQAVRRIIITGRPDLGMPNFAERKGRPADFQPLSSADVDDLGALIADWRTADKNIGQTAESNGNN
jgi:mono/diheme cytochrome c family protein